MAYMVLLGTELGLRDGTQIAIKGVVDKLKGKVKKVIVIISQIIVVAFAAIMTKASFAMVLKQAAIGQTSPGLGIPMSVPYFFAGARLRPDRRGAGRRACQHDRPLQQA